MDKHIDHQEDIPNLAEQIENALARSAGSRASSYRTAPPPRRKPIPQMDLPPIPSMINEGFSSLSEVSPFADPIFGSPNVRPRFVHVRQSTHTMK